MEKGMASQGEIRVTRATVLDRTQGKIGEHADGVMATGARPRTHGAHAGMRRLPHPGSWSALRLWC